jgi:predicted DNA-binding transcriptional regulator
MRRKWKRYSLQYFKPLEGLVWSLSIGRNVKSYQIFKELEELGIKNPFRKSSFSERGVRTAIKSLVKNGYLKEIKKDNERYYIANLNAVLAIIKSTYTFIKVEPEKLEKWIERYKRLLYFISLILFRDIYIEKSGISWFDRTKLKPEKGRKAFLHAVFNEIAQLFTDPFRIMIIKAEVTQGKLLTYRFIEKYYLKKKEIEKEIKEFEKIVSDFFEKLEGIERRKFFLNIITTCIKDFHPELDINLEVFSKFIEKFTHEEKIPNSWIIINKNDILRKEIENLSKKCLKKLVKQVEKLLIDYMEKTPSYILEELNKKRIGSKLLKKIRISSGSK